MGSVCGLGAEGEGVGGPQSGVRAPAGRVGGVRAGQSRMPAQRGKVWGVKTDTLSALRYYLSQWSRVVRVNAMAWREHGGGGAGVDWEFLARAREAVAERNRLRAEIRRRERFAAEEARDVWRFKLTIVETNDGLELVVERKGQ